jgi:hypothetical protein
VPIEALVLSREKRLLVAHVLGGHTAKTRHQKRPLETGGTNGASIAKFRTRRQSHICKMPRYRAVFERPSYVTRWRRTGWLGRQESNLCIRNLCSRWLHCCRAFRRGQIVHGPAGIPRSAATLAPHDSVRPNRARFLMQRFDSTQNLKSTRNRAVPGHFADIAWSPCVEVGRGSATPAPSGIFAWAMARRTSRRSV